jgi:hypothetical protein
MLDLKHYWHIWQIKWMLLFLPGSAFSQISTNHQIAVLKVELLPNPAVDSLFIQESPQIFIHKKSRSSTEPSPRYAHRIVPAGERSATFLFAKDNDSVSIMVVTSIQFKVGLPFAKSIDKVYYMATVLRAGDTVTVRKIFPQPCQYDRTILDKTCPRCNQTDSVRMLFLGCRSFDTEETDPPFSSIGYWDMFMEPTDCNPNWYCLRDEFAF